MCWPSDLSALRNFRNASPPQGNPALRRRRVAELHPDRGLRHAYPHVSIAVMMSHHPSRNTPKMFDRLLKGWRLAGLPEE